ncbi:ADP-ribose 1''-phosphate phosphatase [Penicillium atrosanguineum]|nr:ADP-ribose 1''-phosphate phosphatase [Penicillium atrosanguineum]
MHAILKVLGGAGIAKVFKLKYPAAYRYYRSHCQTYRYGVTNHTILNLQAEDESTIKVRLPLGTALVIPPQQSDCKGGRKAHWIICLFTSRDYGKRVDSPDMIINSTHAALQDLKSQVNSLQNDIQGSQKPPPGELWSCRFNSGLFGVPWGKTRSLLDNVGLDLRVVYPADDTKEIDERKVS